MGRHWNAGRLAPGGSRGALEETFDEEGFFRTGDGGYVDDQGRLVWEGRLTDIIKTGGFKVSPAVVEAVIREVPGVRDGVPGALRAMGRMALG